MLTFLLTCLSGLCIGLYDAIQPGPLMALIVTESIHRGRRAGMKVGCVPLVTDTFILLFGVFFVAVMPNKVAALLSFVGAAVLILIGRQSLRELKTAPIVGIPSTEKKTSGKSPFLSESLFAKAMVVNLLNPYLYLFTFTINAPIISGHLKRGQVFSAVGYPIAFFAGFVSVNAVIAIMAGAFKNHGSPRMLRHLSRFLGYWLFFMAALAIGRGLSFLYC